MDFVESTKIVFDRIRELEPENVSKIIGFLLLQDGGDRRITELVSCSDTDFRDLVYAVKAELEVALKQGPISPTMNSAPVSELSSQFNPFSPIPSRPLLPPTTFWPPSNYWDPQIGAPKHNPDFIPQAYLDSIAELQNRMQQLSFEEEMESVNLGNMGLSSDYYYSDSAFGNLGPRAGRRYPTVFEFPVKTCHYFNKGFCRHGSNCRYFHGQVSENTPQMLGHYSNGINDDQIFSPASLEKLEREIVELLRSRNRGPVSIASLPMLYFEKYGKVLQAEGYLTESQRHGKAGYSLTKLLARLKTSIRLIDRPHGQHAVILAEDASKYLGNRNERNDPGPIVSGSRQIYLTFPAESTFTEDDVSNYFSSFGPVEDVRIPCQQKRMFGFVTFENADTVKMVFSKGNPHFVCGARVLVKPYREKSKLVDRKYQDRIESPGYYPHRGADMDTEFYSMPRGYETSRLFRKQHMEEHDQALELERRHLAELQVARKHAANHPYYDYSTDERKLSEARFNMPSGDRFSYLLGVLSSGSPNDDKIRHTETNRTDQVSNQVLNLPESPFASPLTSSISSLI
ncbi:zinc finger CCCH domain-containing protein 18-like isoform X2 [Tripterygium wilfordii]|uniref:Zinc finger CCCH domain-containing protein 18-like isoform X2 n=1 Tax=Tripterygium wilfordii TaxID=458696 RepID=A0A7J7C992_TRIWF|nr:zinc finger CCCH domain-containing protein 18-like [Tripterygium wilfordii]KAF5730495.1 zinc finger CCCH domain-containing protein 18-like isoform X2 [Tripterygium wilfordii]